MLGDFEVVLGDVKPCPRKTESNIILSANFTILYFVVFPLSLQSGWFGAPAYLEVVDKLGPSSRKKRDCGHNETANRASKMKCHPFKRSHICKLHVPVTSWRLFGWL